MGVQDWLKKRLYLGKANLEENKTWILYYFALRVKNLNVFLQKGNVDVPT